ncbi:hypothetical protein L9F63_005437, partial [Diploptera punctata]
GVHAILSSLCIKYPIFFYWYCSTHHVSDDLVISTVQISLQKLTFEAESNSGPPI